MLICYNCSVFYSHVSSFHVPTNIEQKNNLSYAVEKRINQLRSKLHALLHSYIASLGNHEFDEAVAGLVPFIHNLSAPVLAANLILDKVPELQKEENLKKSIILTVNRRRIGIIGYLTPDTKFLSPKTDVQYEDEITAITREVAAIQKEGVEIIIALGHSGFLKDLEIAKNIPGLDLVIGGHSNTFLTNLNKTDEKPEIPDGPYPTMIEQASGKIVPVVQAYAYTKYLGSLHLKFDNKGEIIEISGKPILLNYGIPQDPLIYELVNKYHTDMDKISNIVIGSSNVFLDGNCRLRQCTMGNLIVDAMIEYLKERKELCAPIAIIQGGRIRSSIDRDPKPMNLTQGDFFSVLPFSDTLVIVTMNGSTLRKALEHSVSTWRTIDSTGQFIQFSGMRVTFDLARPPFSRVVSAEAIGVVNEVDCVKTDLINIEEHIEYKLMMPTFLAEGGDGYSVFEQLPREPVTFNENVCVFDYLERNSPATPTISDRLIVLNEDKLKPPVVLNEILQSKSNSVKRLNYSSNLIIASFVILNSLFFMLSS